jgi:pyruvate kinase
MSADVVPAYTVENMQEIIDSNVAKIKGDGGLKDGDTVVIVQGELAGTPGSTNTMRLVKV